MFEADKSDILALRKTISIMMDRMEDHEMRVKGLANLVKTLTQKVDEANNSILFFLNEDMPEDPVEPN